MATNARSARLSRSLIPRQYWRCAVLATRTLDYIEYSRSRSAIGDPRQVRERLLAIAAELDADELVVLTITYAFEARVRSYELLAEAFGLDGVTDGER